MNKFKICFLIFFIFLQFYPTISFARENVDYWYIKDFQTEIVVNKDSSLDIIEKITVDCGRCRGKHGIFRTLATRYSSENGKFVNAPIDLISITDFNDRPHSYKIIKDRINYILTWQIGDPNIEVQGENFYKIAYKVKNVLRTENPDFDEFYWNLSGNFWDIDVDQFSAIIRFPSEINQATIKELYLYSGFFGEKDAELAEYRWLDQNTLEVRSLNILRTDSEGASEGITLSATFSKGIVASHQPTAWEKYGDYSFFLIPFFVFLLCFGLWSKYGRDPKINPTIAPEFEVPENLSPIEIGTIYTNGVLKSRFLSAGLIDCAVKNAIKIKELKPDDALGNLLKKKDFELSLNPKTPSILGEDEKLLLVRIFKDKDKILLSDLIYKFSRSFKILEKFILKRLGSRKLISPETLKLKWACFGLGVFFIIAGFVFATLFSLMFWFNMGLAGLIMIAFAFLMPRRTVEGFDLFRRIQGFKLYLETAEKYRQRFFEKENIFERFLPYAMIFGLTNLWIKKMAAIYDEDWLANYHPVWFSGLIANFNVDSLDSAISSLSSTMASTLSSSPSSSGSGGGGFSGGGGGGGGGGGW